jgi:Na+-translocating ferredoxin:NAD+ oxidoreductase RnfC subunit
MVLLIKTIPRLTEPRAGDRVYEGDILGVNPRTLEAVVSPISGMITEIFITANRRSLMLVIDSSGRVNDREMADAEGEAGLSAFGG